MIRRVTGALRRRVPCLLVAGLFLPALALAQTANRAPAAASRTFADRQIVILYDQSNSVRRKAEARQTVNDAIRNLLVSGQVTLARERAGDYATNTLTARRVDLPLWRPGDCVSSVGFGMNRMDLESGLVGTGEWWPRWTAALVRPIVPVAACPARADVLGRLLDETFADRDGYYYTMSYYALPALAAAWPGTYARQSFVVWVSDFFSGQRANQQTDEKLAERYLGDHISLLRGSEADFNQRFAVQDALWRVNVEDVFDALKAELLEVSPVAQPQLSFDRGEAEVSRSPAGWSVRLPRLAVAAVPDAPSAFRFDAIDLVWNVVPGGPQHVVPLAATPEAGRLQTLPVVQIPATDIRERIPQVRMFVRAAVTYAPAGPYGFRFPLQLRTGDLVAQLPGPVAEASGPPWRMVAASVALALAGTVLLLSFRDASVVGAIDWTHDGIARDGIYEFSWLKGSVLVPIRFRRIGGGFRGVPVGIRLGPMQGPAGLTVGVVFAGSKIKAAADGVHHLPAVSLLHSTSTGMLELDLRHLPEPDAVSAPLQFAVDLLSGPSPIPGGPVVVRFRRPLGGFWIGLDPGTSGSCVAGGDTIEAVSLVPLNESEQVHERRFVAPSIVSLCSGPDERVDDCYRTSIRRGELTLRFIAGALADSRRDMAGRQFRSAKRMIGTRTPTNLEYGAGRVDVRGRDAVEALCRYLVDSAKRHFTAGGPGEAAPRINKIVVAVPNTFTPGRIKTFRDCCRSAGIAEVKHVFEAEAIVWYYICHSKKLLGDKARAAAAARAKKNGEHVIVFDFGGGSANLTYVRVGMEDDRPVVFVLQRLGFAFGGDRLDWEIGRFLWSRAPDAAKGSDLYAVKADPALRAPRLEWLAMASSVKRNVSDYHREGRVDASVVPPARLFDSLAEGGGFTAKDVASSEGVKEVLRDIERGAAELMQLCQGTGVWKGADRLIITGRSSRFPGVVEHVRRGLGAAATDEQVLRLNDDAKTCVAEGACCYGLIGGRSIRQERAFAFYGARRFTSADRDDASWEEIIRPGAPFGERGCTGTTSAPLKYPFNSGTIEIYQVMAASLASAPTAREDPSGRRTLVTRFSGIDDRRSVEAITLTLKADDSFTARLSQAGAEREAQGEVEIDDIRDGGDKSAEWLV